jgi:magnesium chelatase accessory protein
MMPGPLDWDTDGKDWPNREASRFVEAGGIRWHVQVMGEGPALLLLHGTGSSTHTWRDVMPILARSFTVVAPDLPGHAFTMPVRSRDQSLPAMAKGVAALVETLKLPPKHAAGHSAGAAILVHMSLDRHMSPDAIVSFNGAFFPFMGAAGQFFSPLAKVIASASMMPRFFAAMADDAAVERLIRDTGSKLDARGLALYRKLFGNEAHVAGTLGMMGHWDLTQMESDLRHLRTFLYLVSAANDRTVSPQTAARAARFAPRSALITIPGLGHLAHEEDPALAAEIITYPARFVQP